MSKINIVFDASKLDMFNLCAERFNNTYNLNIRLPRKATPLDRGTLVHLASEVYYNSIKNGVKYQDAVDLALHKTKEAGVTSTDLDNDTINRVIEVMEEYFEYWRHEDQYFIINEVEQPFMYKLFEDDDIIIYLSGKIDMVVSDNKYVNLPYDHKSYDRSYETGRMTNQFMNYCCATNSNYLVVNKIGFQKTLKPHEKFKRVPLSYDHLILEQWKNNVISILKHYVDCVINSNWPMNYTSCDKYNRQCEYYNLCDSSGKEAKSYKILSDYIVVPEWDVTKSMRKSSEALEDKRKERELDGKSDETRPSAEEA